MGVVQGKKKRRNEVIVFRDIESKIIIITNGVGRVVKSVWSIFVK